MIDYPKDYFSVFLNTSKIVLYFVSLGSYTTQTGNTRTTVSWQTTDAGRKLTQETYTKQGHTESKTTARHYTNDTLGPTQSKMTTRQYTTDSLPYNSHTNERYNDVQTYNDTQAYNETHKYNDTIGYNDTTSRQSRQQSKSPGRSPTRQSPTYGMLHGHLWLMSLASQSLVLVLYNVQS